MICGWSIPTSTTFHANVPMSFEESLFRRCHAWMLRDPVATPRRGESVVHSRTPAMPIMTHSTRIQPPARISTRAPAPPYRRVRPPRDCSRCGFRLNWIPLQGSIRWPCPAVPCPGHPFVRCSQRCRDRSRLDRGNHVQRAQRWAVPTFPAVQRTHRSARSTLTCVREADSFVQVLLRRSGPAGQLRQVVG